jgi:hypothetical protein
MKKKIVQLFIISFTCSSLILHAQQIRFQEKFNISNNDNAYYINQCHAGEQGTIMTGFVMGSDGNQQCVLIRIGGNGNVMWTKEYDYPMGSQGSYCAQTLDGGYIVAGGTINAGSVNFYNLIKTDVNGNVQWTKQYEPPSNDYLDDYTYNGIGANLLAVSAKECPDKGYIIAGALEDNSFTISAYGVIKTDSAGQIEWSNNYVNQQSKAEFYKIELANNGYILCGDGLGPQLIRLDNNGAIVWSKYYSDTTYHYFGQAYSVHQTPDSGFIVTGMGSGSNARQLLLLKTDSSGIAQWSSVYYGDTTSQQLWGNCVKISDDGGFIICADLDFSTTQYNNAVLMKTDNAGVVQWCNRYWCAGITHGICVTPAADGGYSFCGNTPDASPNIYFAKADSMGSTGCDEVAFNITRVVRNFQAFNNPSIIHDTLLVHANAPIQISPTNIVTVLCTSGMTELTEENQITVYPNPASGILTFDNLQFEIYHLRIMDVMGREVYSQQISNQQSAIINVSNLTNGIYYWEMISDNTIEGKGKIAIMH